MTVDKILMLQSQATLKDTVQLFLADITFEDFRRSRSKLLLAVHTRPEIAPAAHKTAQAARISINEVDKKYIEKYNSAVKTLCIYIRKTFTYEALDEGSMNLRFYSDASFVTNEDQSTLLGYIVLLCGKDEMCHILDYSSKKCKRVPRFILGGELFAFTEGYNSAYMIQHDLQQIWNRHTLL